MSRRAVLLFVAASLIWGSSFLLIRVAVRSISPSAGFPGAPALGVSTVMMVCSSAVFALPAATHLPRHPPGEASIAALAALGIVNTRLPSWVYFALVREAGAAVTSLITYAVPVVALALGASLLGEHLTIGALAGLVLIASGTWLTARAQRPRLKQRSTAVRDEHTRARPPRSSS